MPKAGDHSWAKISPKHRPWLTNQREIASKRQSPKIFASTQHHAAIGARRFSVRHYLPAFYATALWGSRRLDEAVKVADDCLARAPDFWRCRQDRIAALVELGRIQEAREEADRLLAKVPQMTAQRFGAAFAGTATSLRERRIGAARVAGFPMVTDAPSTVGSGAPK